MKTLFLRICSFLFFVGVLLPAGLLGKLSGRSSFDARAYRTGSAWDKARARRNSAMDSSVDPAGKIDVEKRLSDVRQ